MADDDSLQTLEGLHRDLCALIDNRLPALDRLVHNLEQHIETFKALIDKKPQSDASRKTLNGGRIALDWLWQKIDADAA
jgi:nuclear pore complex protein Nup205